LADARSDLGETLSPAGCDWILEGKSLHRRVTVAVMRASRRTCRLTARLISGRRNHAVKVLNLSSSGAMVSGGRMPRAGENVVLQLRGFELPATVVWSSWPRHGLLFRDLLPRENIDRLIQGGLEGNYPYGGPGMHSRTT
jgi:hypothetical protein